MSQTKIEFSEESIAAFPTRIFRRQYSELSAFNRRMRAIILEKEQADSSGLVRSNVGGWHSNNDLMHWKHPELEVLRALFQSALQDYYLAEAQRESGSVQITAAMEAWANISRKGHYAKSHAHPMSAYSLVYYVDAGDHDNEGRSDVSGNIEFMDPRGQSSMIATPGISDKDSLMVRPADGVLIMFPSWLYHHVHPYQGDRPRISIAANATVRNVTDADPHETAPRPQARIIEGD